MDYWGVSPPMRFDELSYEEKRKFRYDLQDYMHDFFQFDKFSGKKILEVGSGAGIDSCEFARNGANVISADFTEIAIKLTKDLTRKFNGDATRCTSTSLPFNENTFDVVYSFGVIHHVPDIDTVLKEIFRVLKPSGIFMGMVYNKDSLLYAYLMYHYGIKQGEIHKMSEEQLISKFSERREGCPYTKAYTTDEFKQLLQKHNFDNIEAGVFYNTFDIPEYKRKIKFELDDNVELGWHIAFKAKKS